MKRSARLCIGLLMAALLSLGAEASGLKVTKKYPVPGDGGFDYIFSMVQVIDSTSRTELKLTCSMPLPAGCSGW